MKHQQSAIHRRSFSTCRWLLLVRKIDSKKIFSSAAFGHLRAGASLLPARGRLLRCDRLLWRVEEEVKTLTQSNSGQCQRVRFLSEWLLFWKDKKLTLWLFQEGVRVPGCQGGQRRRRSRELKSHGKHFCILLISEATKPFPLVIETFPRSLCFISISVTVINFI